MVAKAQAVTGELIEAFTKPYESSNGARANGAVGAAVATDLGRANVMVELPADEQELRREFARRTWSDGLPVIAPTRGARRGDARILRPRPARGARRDRAAPRRGDGPGDRSVRRDGRLRAADVPRPRRRGAGHRARGVQRQRRQRHDAPEYGADAAQRPDRARGIGAHGGMGCFGPTFETNATLGRAACGWCSSTSAGPLRASATAPRRARPPSSRSASRRTRRRAPGAPFQTTRGFSAEESTVTVYACEAPHNIEDHGSKHTGPRHHADGRRLDGPGGQQQHPREG